VDEGIIREADDFLFAAPEAEELLGVVLLSCERKPLLFRSSSETDETVDARDLPLLLGVSTIVAHWTFLSRPLAQMADGFWVEEPEAHMIDATLIISGAANRISGPKLKDRDPSRRT
jgi:hypothetical protein